MANRYWVGGNDDWDNVAGSKWSATSGGAGGVAVPTSADDVFFDAASGAAIVTITGFVQAIAKNLNFTGFTGTITSAVASNKSISVYGDLTLGVGMTNDFAGTLFFNGGGAQVITSNGVHFNAFGFQISGVGGSVSLADDLFSTRKIAIADGAFDANNKNVTCSNVLYQAASGFELTMGSGLWTLTGVNEVWDFADVTGLTFHKDTANIKITNTSNSALAFSGGGLTYNDVWFARGASTGPITVVGSNTFDDLKDDGSAAHDFKFTDGTTTTVTTFTYPAGGQRALKGTSTGGWNLVCTSGTISVFDCDISYSHASGGATFNAFVSNGNSNAGNNSGWIFTNNPSPVVTTSAASNITDTTADGNGNITNVGGDPILERGFVWGLDPDPTILDDKVVVAGTTGTYSGEMGPLLPDNTYHFRAYATTAAGTTYGDDLTFDTGTVLAKIGALDTGFDDFGEPIYFELIDRWRSFTDLYAKVKNISGLNMYTENAAGTRVYFQSQKSQPNVWEDIDTITEANNALFPNANTQDFEVGRLRLAGFSKGTPIVIHGMEILSIQDKGFDQN